MKIQIASDLHLEFLNERFPGFLVVEPTEAEVLVLAGDIHKHTYAIDAFQNWPVPVLYVSGNHELYHAHAFGLIDQLRKRSAAGNVRYLERNVVVINNVRFLGCCLWTDYGLFGESSNSAMREAERSLVDHEVITTRGGATFSARDARRIHFESRAWLEEQLARPYSGKTVVITHHAPHPNSLHPRYSGSLLNAAFASDLTSIISKADIWIHGHVHDSVDYQVGTTHVIANPRGYPQNRHSAQKPADLVWENPAFNARLTVDIESIS
jgi:predicted phosphodiesterase